MGVTGSLVVLFLSAIVGGLLFIRMPITKRGFRLSLIFAGSYLFAITIVDLLPHMYREFGDIQILGFGVLIGFFLQQVLEFFSRGIEHGHLPHDSGNSMEGSRRSFGLAAGSLCLHALLEGGLLAGFDREGIPALMGIVIHKAPAAYALMAIALASGVSNSRAILILVLFAVMSPVGMLLAGRVEMLGSAIPSIVPWLFAIVAGSFLHISTTIVFESDGPSHTLGTSKFLAALAAAILAVLTVLVV